MGHSRCHHKLWPSASSSLASLSLTISILLVVSSFAPISCSSSHWSSSQLSEFNERATSTSFGEPIFRLEPPPVINFANTRGATIPCLVSGSPRPTISWFASSGGTGAFSSEPLEQVAESLRLRPISNATNLRLIQQNGSILKLLPFNEEDFRQEIHSTEYRCVASNQVATIHSRSVTVQAVMSNGQLQQQVDDANNHKSPGETNLPDSLTGTVKVSDEFVAMNSIAVLKCRTNQAPEFSQLIEWFTSDGLTIRANDLAKANKFVALKSGELQVNQVNLNDLQRTYGCRIRNSITQQTASSSGLAQLIATDGGQLQQPEVEPQVVHTVNQLIALDTSGRHKDAGRSFKSPPYRAASDDLTGSESDNEADDEEDNKLIIMPCALRGVSGRNLHLFRWMFQPASSNNKQPAPVPLDQWAAARSLSVHYLSPNQTSGSAHPLSWAQNSTGSRARSSQWSASGAEMATSYWIGPTFLAIEWPTKAQSGRYLFQWAAANGSGAITMCDINVIIRQPMRLRLEAALQQQSYATQDQMSMSMAQQSSEPQPNEAANWLQRAFSWLNIRTIDRKQPDEMGAIGGRVTKRQVDEGLYKSNPLIEAELRRIQVRGAGLVPDPPIVRVGQQLKLHCRARGHPLEGVKWFRNGLAINTQSSSDFQVEISSFTSGSEQPEVDEWQPLSSLTIRQIQAKESGLNMFECFGHNSLGDRARAGLLVFVADRRLLEWALDYCPLNATATGYELMDLSSGDLKLEPSSGETSSDDEEDDEDQMEEEGDSFANGQEFDGSYLGANQARTMQLSGAATFRRHNPMQRALIIESEPVELLCPSTSAYYSPHRRVVNPPTSGQQRAVEWRRLMLPAAGNKAQGLGQRRLEANRRQQQVTSTDLSYQLFAGDSRFVINGSSLQIRAPSRRHDEAFYACRLAPPASVSIPATGSSGSAAGGGATGSSATRSRRQTEARGPKKRAASSSLQVHQSSSLMDIASTSCGSSLFRSPSVSAPSAGEMQVAAGREPMSSISIRIVGRPKLDSFEFSRNLEEGMRTIVVCAVISGQSPIDISWFKDGRLLLADESQQISIDQSNGFSSTLTFHKIRPSQSGQYTCVASNAFASTNHSSRLLVNVAPYFINPPKNTRAVLNSNVLVNCRAGGQPSPQIRWRKLVPSGSSASGSAKQVALAGGQQAKQPLDPFSMSSDLEPFLRPTSGVGNLQQMAPVAQSNEASNRPLEYRIVTSNSHIQILENGSMIIKEVELSDASRYVCQAFNGINPSLSEAIELQVLSPAQFEANYETVSVKRDSMVKFNCAPRGDQPIQIEWLKEGQPLVPIGGGQTGSANVSYSHQTSGSKYSELAHLAPTSGSDAARQRHSSLVLHSPPLSSNQTSTGQSPAISQQEQSPGVRMSELLISYADRGDTGNFVCVARNAYGRDELTYRLVVQEPPDVPLNLHTISVQSNSLKLLWSPPFDGNLPLSHFVVEYRRAARHEPPQAAHLFSQAGDSSTTSGRSHGANEWTRLVVSTSQLSAEQSPAPSSMAPITQQRMQQQPASQQQQQVQYSINLRQLTARATYHIRLAAVNAIGQSAFSDPVTVTTAEEPPNSRPDDLRAQPVSSSSLRVLWRGPALPDERAPIKGYYISHRKLASATDGDKQQAESNVQASGAWTATGSLSAQNSTNFRPAAADAMGQSEQQATGKLQQVSQLQQLSYEYLLSALDKNSKYEIRVQPYNSMGVGPASETLGQTLKFDRPSRPALRLVGARRQSFELKWTIGDDQPLMGFSLFYKCEYDDWQEIQLGAIHHYVIENLRCGTRYQIYLSAFNVVGRSDPSDVLSVRTEGTAPIAPEKSQFIRSNITEVLLDMSQWQSGGCPISSFVIQFKRLHDSNWFVLSEGATPLAVTDKTVIPDLTPATWYKLMMQAVNEAGSTDAEYQFSTLTSSGEQLPAPAPAPNYQSPGGGSSKSSVLGNLNQLLFSASDRHSGSSSMMDQQQGQLLLLPMSCLLLILVTLLASYLYYSRSLAKGRASERRQKGGASNLGGQQRDLSSDLTANSNRPLLLAAGSRASEGEKQLVQSGDHLVQHHLIGAHPQSLPLDAAGGSLALDSLLNHQASGFGQANSAGTMQRGAGTMQRAHGMKLLSASGNLFGPSTGVGSGNGSSQCTNSSLSTHSTNCNFDCGASSQGSSSGTSALGGARAKLQLIDESSLISGSNIPEDIGELHLQQQQHQLAQQQIIYGQQVGDHLSPARQVYATNFRSPHVDILDGNGAMIQQQPMGMDESSMVDHHHQLSGAQVNFIENLFANGDHQQTEQQQNDTSASGPRLYGSTSFASAADLLQRQQHQQQLIFRHQEQEPIYQRLDSFHQAYGLSKQQQQLAAALSQVNKAQTLRLNNTTAQHASLDHDQLCQQLKSMTLHRNAGLSQQQQQTGSQPDSQFSLPAAGAFFQPPNGYSDQFNLVPNSSDQQSACGNAPNNC